MTAPKQNNAKAMRATSPSRSSLCRRLPIGCCPASGFPFRANAGGGHADCSTLKLRARCTLASVPHKSMSSVPAGYWQFGPVPELGLPESRLFGQVECAHLLAQPSGWNSGLDSTAICRSKGYAAHSRNQAHFCRLVQRFRMNPRLEALPEGPRGGPEPPTASSLWPCRWSLTVAGAVTGSDTSAATSRTTVSDSAGVRSECAKTLAECGKRYQGPANIGEITIHIGYTPGYVQDAAGPTPDRPQTAWLAARRPSQMCGTPKWDLEAPAKAPQSHINATSKPHQSVLVAGG